MPPAPRLAVVDAGEALVWRVGRAPDPWAWTDRQYAGHNRWDDRDGVFRTIYAGDTLYACYVELLAYARPDTGPDGKSLLAGVTEDPQDAAEHPTPAAGGIPASWITGRMTASATLSGRYADVRAADTIAALRPVFLHTARRLGLPDFDAAALKLARPRELTQRVAHHLYTLSTPDGAPLVDGIRFASRHGDDLPLWAVFERPGDQPASRRLHQTTARLVDRDDPDLHRAMTLHHLTWR